MGGAQAGEVASRLAVEAFQGGLPDGGEPEAALAALAQAANTRIHELSHANAEQAGMGTTLTAVYVGERDIAIAHVGDSRAYCLRDGELLRLTDDHSLVDELMRQGRLTPEEAVEHPQRSVITRALGIEGAVEVDTRSFKAQRGRRLPDLQRRPHDDGLRGARSPRCCASTPRLRDAGEALIAEANRAGGRDNITVVLLRLEEVRRRPQAAKTAARNRRSPGCRPCSARPRRARRRPPAAQAAAAPAPVAQAPPVAQRRPRTPGRSGARAGGAQAQAAGAARGRGARRGSSSSRWSPPARSWRSSRCTSSAPTSAGWSRSTRESPSAARATSTLYSSRYVSGVGAATLSPHRRSTLLDHSLRSEGEGRLADPQPRTRPARMSDGPRT